MSNFLNEDGDIKPIAIVQGAAGAEIQQLFRDFIARHAASARIVGLVEDARGLAEDGSREPGRLRNITDGRHYPMFQDLGAGSSGCAFDPQGVVLAAEAVENDIAAGCDLVVLSKFGKYEAENRSGLVSAFQAAIGEGAPVLTSVSPRHAEAWEAFAAPFFTVLPAELAAIEAWWASVRGGVTA